MTPWLLFGAGGKGVGARTLELALAEQRPVVAVVRHADAATKLAQQGNVTVQGFILCIPVPALAHPGQVSDNHAVTMATQTEALHFPGAGVNITDRGDLPLKQCITE